MPLILASISVILLPGCMLSNTTMLPKYQNLALKHCLTTTHSFSWPSLLPIMSSVCSQLTIFKRFFLVAKLFCLIYNPLRFQRVHTRMKGYKRCGRVTKPFLGSVTGRSVNAPRSCGEESALSAAFASRFKL